MKKKLIMVILLLACVVGLIAGGVVLLSPQESISTHLSARSQQFLQQQKFNADSDLADASNDTVNSNDTRNTRVNVTDCFSFIMPYHVDNSRNDEKCMGYYSFTSPSGKVVTYRRPGTFTNFDSVEGVSFRRNNPQTYTETSKTIKGRNFLIFTTKDGPWEANAFTYGKDYYLVFNLMMNDSESRMDDLVTILASLEMK